MDAAASGEFFPPDENAAAYGEVVWSWRRDPSVKLARSIAPATVAKQAAHRGEHEGNRKTIARGKRKPKKSIQINAVCPPCRYLCRDPRRPLICCAKTSTSARRTEVPP